MSKSGKGRKIPINSKLAELFSDVQLITKGQGEYVFSGAKPLKDIRASFATAIRQAGIDRRFRFHDLRHTVASRLVTENNVDLVTAAKILGHSTTRMLERYAHTRRKIEVEAVESLGVSQLHKNCTIGKIKGTEKENFGS